MAEPFVKERADEGRHAPRNQITQSAPSMRSLAEMTEASFFRRGRTTRFSPLKWAMLFGGIDFRIQTLGADDGVGADAGVSAENGGVGVDGHMILDVGMALDSFDRDRLRRRLRTILRRG